MRRLDAKQLVLSALCVFLATACSVDRTGLQVGGGSDGGVVDLSVLDAGDAGLDASTDRDLDASLDADRFDAALDAEVLDAGIDAGEVDASLDADRFDAALDAEALDAGIDAGEVDASMTHDAGDVDAGSDDAGEPDAGGTDAAGPDAGSGCTPRCVGSTLEDCTALGTIFSVPCGVLGCIETAGVGACGRVRASHVSDPALLFAGTAAVSVDTPSWTINTDTGEILDGVTVVRAAGAAGDATGILFRTEAQGGGAPELGIFSMGSLTVASGASITGVGGRALVLLVAWVVTIDGVIDVGARDGTAGPGGHDGGAARGAAAGPGGGAAGGLEGWFGEVQAGGGGGGHAGLGGRGGNETVIVGTDAQGGSGGAVIVDGDAVLLYGGGGGGAGANAASGGPGGGGGGALQITSGVSITVTATGVLRAPGGGGRGGSHGGGGGGAGGTVMLEAPDLSVLGVVVANGGGGGGADNSITSGAGNGARGGDSTARAAGGGGVGLGAGSGGQGGADASLGGADGASGGGGGAGGGAGAGRLFFSALAGAASVGGTTSPTDAAARITLVLSIY